MKKGKPKKVTISKLNIQKTSDYEFVGKWKSRGIKFRLGVTAFIKTLFELNEELPTTNKMTNAELERQVLNECGHVESTATAFATKMCRINSYRYKYNSGTITKPYFIPNLLSFRYDIHGKPVDTRSGRNEMTPDDIAAYIDKYVVRLLKHAEEDAESLRERMYVAHEKHFCLKLPRTPWQPGKTSKDE